MAHIRGASFFFFPFPSLPHLSSPGDFLSSLFLLGPAIGVVIGGLIILVVKQQNPSPFFLPFFSPILLFHYSFSSGHSEKRIKENRRGPPPPLSPPPAAFLSLFFLSPATRNRSKEEEEKETSTFSILPLFLRSQYFFLLFRRTFSFFFFPFRLSSKFFLPFCAAEAISSPPSPFPPEPPPRNFSSASRRAIERAKSSAIKTSSSFPISLLLPISDDRPASREGKEDII